MTSGAEPGRDARGTRGAVTSDHRLATEAGLTVLQEGGNAMDAAITAAVVLTVARPHMCGPGGDLFLLYYEAATGTVHALNGSGPSGSGASRAALLAAHPGATAMPEEGPHSISVPGAVRAWEAALQRFGSLTWQQALEPAVALARDGLPVSRRLSLDIAEESEKLRRNAEAERIYLPAGAPPPAGWTLRQDDLAGSLALLQSRGAGEFYQGDLGRRISAHLEAAGGFLQPGDFSGYQPSWVEPITIEYGGLTVAAFPPNTQGVAFLEELGLLMSIPLAPLGHNSADYLHALAEVIRLAVADRDGQVGDPRYMRVTVAELLEPGRLARMAETVDPQGSAATATLAPGADHPNTVYLSAVDHHGNAVSLIQSLYAGFGSGIVVPGTGVILHNRAALFSLSPAHPNALGPGKLPYHTLCPLLALKQGRPWLVFGTPGGDGQTHTNLQVLHNILLFGMTPQQAIDAPRMRRLPGGELAIEDQVPEAVRSELERRRYRVLARSPSAEFGGAQAVLCEAGAGGLRAGADRRREAWAAAY